MDVYGTTKAIELLDPTASRLPTAMPWDLSDKAVPEPKGFGPKDLALPTGNLKATWHLCLREHWPTLHTRRGVCHLLLSRCQHPPCALRPHILLQILCLAGLQRYGQVPCVPLADRGGSPCAGPSCSEG
ncbi:E3 ubiquitin-protein ligase NEURL3 isoform X2 [Hylobates moloch]|uniref:E3 ubiquitin-protein ligase NEURL3 isoform X2 n=1 Tax=Hylobates moloch TaxID=81572 RepID=UPI00136294A5|nr:E3 ubiquitin-protein ligase NEURL3 isoform X2 [Hylobates moloch]